MGNLLVSLQGEVAVLAKAIVRVRSAPFLEVMSRPNNQYLEKLQAVLDLRDYAFRCPLNMYIKSFVMPAGRRSNMQVMIC